MGGHNRDVIKKTQREAAEFWNRKGNCFKNRTGKKPEAYIRLFKGVNMIIDILGELWSNIMGIVLVLICFIVLGYIIAMPILFLIGG